MIIDEAVAGSTLTAKGKTFFVGLFSYKGDTEYEEAVTPKAYVKDADEWRLLGEGETRWKDGESRNHSPEYISGRDLDALNVFISAELGVDEMSWFQEYTHIYNNRIAFDGDSVVIV